MRNDRKQGSNVMSFRPVAIAVMAGCWVWTALAIFAGFSLSHDIVGAGIFSLAVGLSPVVLVAILMGLLGATTSSG